MGKGIALWKGDTWDTGWGTLDLDHDGTLTIRTAEGEASVALSLDHSAFVDAYATDRWLYAVGSADKEVVLAASEGPRIAVIATVNRWQKDARTAFGSHAVRFHPRPGRDECLLAWELGVVLIDPEAGCVWSHFHGDPDQRVLKITTDVVVLHGRHQVLTIDLSTGTLSTRTVQAQLGVDQDTLAEWRQGIGR